MSTFLTDFINEIEEKGLTVLYVQVYQDGRQLDFWSRFHAQSTDGMSAFEGVSRVESYSMAKSFAGIGAGIAIDEGLITLDERIADSFPELTYDISDSKILGITVEDMLKMASGMSEPMFFRDSIERRECRDWLRRIYSQGEFGYERGSQFLYSNVNPYMLGCLIERKYGKNLLEYMRYRLFEPLGIGNPDMTQCPMGHTIAANGLDINCEELSRFGLMLLNKGVYNDRRIVSRAFVEAALSPQIKTDQKPFWPSKNDTLEYGYQFWVDSANHCSYAWGILGQFCMILPDKNAVVTVQALETDNTVLGTLLWKHIVEKL